MEEHAHDQRGQDSPRRGRAGRGDHAFGGGEGRPVHDAWFGGLPAERQDGQRLGAEAERQDLQDGQWERHRADVGTIQRRSFVDAVVGHRDDLALGAQCAGDPQLGLGRRPGEHDHGVGAQQVVQPVVMDGLGVGDDPQRGEVDAYLDLIFRELPAPVERWKPNSTTPDQRHARDRPSPDSGAPTGFERV
nr:hypothetical protein [Actinomadura macrotermitis]